jgi:hypothetical protein
MSDELTGLFAGHTPIFRPLLIECHGCAKSFGDWQVFAAHVVDAVLAEFLVVPRSEIVGTEYGWRRSEGAVEVNSEDLAGLSAYIRELTGEDSGLYFEHLTRRVPAPVTPLPENGDNA